MITDEMMNVAYNAAADWTVKSGVGDSYPHSPMIYAALTAAYPLIRAQAIEECAKVCEDNMMLVRREATPRNGVIYLNYETAHRIDMNTIREMKGDV